jgi:hypothetical protein
LEFRCAAAGRTTLPDRSGGVLLRRLVRRSGTRWSGSRCRRGKGKRQREEDRRGRTWGANVDAIATLLSGANPRNWPLADMKKMMRDHLDLTTAELVAYLQKDWNGGVAAYDRVHDQILHMADMLAEGIAKQFPNKV